MTTLYRPVLINTAEQAEALPIGTMAYLDEGATRHVAHKLQENCWIRTDMGDLYSPAQDDCMCPGIFPDTWTALVPIEAEEEWTGGGNGFRWHMPDRESAEAFSEPIINGHVESRLVTPWEEA
ncbi:MAG: hypothetical protein ACTH6A_06640 [Brachybacterium tyrofermentans]|uniref:hypothetical protein n=1 Tax=Brachybacterium tyrofermentans TaxID=47848 RepID=UPI003F92EB99